MARKCACSGPCGPEENGENGMTRRGFVTLLGVGTVGALMGTSVTEAMAAEDRENERVRWTNEGNPARVAPRLYRSALHSDARMPLGGIGTGNIELGVDGQFTTWQLFNTLRDGHVPLFFAIRAGNHAKLLQTTGGPVGLPHIPAIEMTGEYPLATLRFRDPELPIEAEMTAFSPFAPLDTRLSSMPVAAFVFRLHNPTNVVQSVSLGAFLQNPVGYDALGPVRSFNSFGFNAVDPRFTVAHPNHGGNVNKAARTGHTALLTMHAEHGTTPTLDRPLTVYTNLSVDTLNQFPVERPVSLKVATIGDLANAASTTDSAQKVIWLENVTSDLAAVSLRAASDAARAGATVVFSGTTFPLLQEYARAIQSQKLVTDTPADILFADFENGYTGWTVEGDAFGTQPATGTLPNQQAVSGFLGKGLVNTYLNGDTTTGRLISRSFTIERNYIRFLVGGGSHPNTQIRLLIDNKVVQATSGKDNELLLPARWDVREWRGKTAHIEIVDEEKGGWGHINVDHIEFSDMPFSLEVITLLDEMLPARFTGIQSESGTIAEFTGVTLQADATSTKVVGGPILLTRKFGKGQTIIVGGSLLNGQDAALIGARQHAYAALATLVGAKYTHSVGVPKDAPGAGTLALATLQGDTATALVAFEDWHKAWETFAVQGHFAPLSTPQASAPTPTGRTVNGALATTVEVPAGKSIEVVYLLTWHYPNKYSESGAMMGNHYTTLWPDAHAVAEEASRQFSAIREKTERFHKTFYDSTLPYGLLDCVSSQISTIRHIGVVFRIANGDIYAWEGSNGCCPPTCTHVWGYEQTLAYLFPDLEKEMRRIDFVHQQGLDGGVNNRTDVPSPPHPTGERPFSDGHASCILKAYREARNHPDDSWLKVYWPRIKQGVEYLIARDAATSDGTPDGTLSDDQWNTYDNAIHGVNSFIGTYYLAALRAAEEMAKRMGDTTSAQRFHDIFLKGQDNLVKLCWNGEYFEQNLPDYAKRAGEFGPGCLSDQLIGQWWAHQLGLGYLLPVKYVQTALRSVYKYNWLTDHTNWKHNWRKFAGGKDKGLLICTWPKGGRPADTIPYVDEVWTGIEYQVAAHMIYEGMVEEGMTIVQGVRSRYDGVPRSPIPRNPWNEIECGGHYARAMSSWSLLHALSGFEYDGMAKSLRFTPSTTPENFKSFFCAAQGWGSLKQTRLGKTQRNQITVAEGRLTVGQLHLVGESTAHQAQVTIGGKAIAATVRNDGTATHITLRAPVTLKRGETITVHLS